MSAPTDLELMMLLDGELDAERRAEVEAFLAESGEDEGAPSRGKLAGMRAVSRIVGAMDWPDAGVSGGRSAAPYDVADVVLAALPALDAKSGPAATHGVAKADVRPADEAPAQAEPGRAVQAPRAVVPAGSRPANDNSRAIFGIAIAAAAAAAAVFIWGKSADDAGTAGPAPVAMTASAPGDGSHAAPPVADDPGLLGDLADVAKPDPGDEPRYGVEVAAVDFGARSGAIYYVPGIEDAAGKAAVTTVVWLNDD